MSETPAPYDADVKQFTLRLPALLHAKVRNAAEAKGGRAVITDEIIERLESSFRPADTVSRLMVNLELPRAVRLSSVGNTSADVDRLLQLATLLSAERWIFAARADELNGAVLVLYIEAQGSQLVVVHDHSHINMARRPRMLDVQQLIKALDAFGVMQFAEYCPKLLPDTRDQSPVEAAATIIAAGQKEFVAATYLKLLAQHDAFDLAEFTPKKALPTKPSKRRP